LGHLYNLQREDASKVPPYGSTTAEIIDSVAELETFDELVRKHEKKNKALLGKSSSAFPKAERFRRKMN
jgi:hypothetical protein